MEGRGVGVGHSTICRRVRKSTPRLEAALRKGKERPVGKSWRMDKTYIKVNGQWKCLCRAVGKDGQTVDSLLTAHRDRKAALRFFRKAVRRHGLPDKATIDKGGANTSAIGAPKEETGHGIEIRRIKCRTTWPGRITGPSSGSSDRCSVSNPSARQEPPCRESNSCT